VTKSYIQEIETFKFSSSTKANILTEETVILKTILFQFVP